jgi:hypothetical protein
LTSTCCSGLRCLLDLLKVMLHLASMRSMSTNIPKIVTWLMVSIQGGQTFVKTIPTPLGPARSHYAKQQESCRKDVEGAFGVLQSRFVIVRMSGIPLSLGLRTKCER